MKEPKMTEKELVNIVNGQKNGKAAGVDGVRAELLKSLIKNSTIREYLLKCCNKVLDEKIQENWLRSNTTMIPKNRKPKIIEHRPIAVTVLSSKIMCTYYREKIEEHLKDCKYGYENQYGFTKGGKIEHCLFILNYVTNMTFERKHRKEKSLYFAFIDFKKAYDSIDRKRLIEVMVKFGINPQIINIIVQMYEGDKTTVNMGKMEATAASQAWTEVEYDDIGQ